MAERIRWKQHFGVTVPVIPAENNIIFKAILRRGKEEGKHDIEVILRERTQMLLTEMAILKETMLAEVKKAEIEYKRRAEE